MHYHRRMKDRKNGAGKRNDKSKGKGKAAPWLPDLPRGGQPKRGGRLPPGVNVHPHGKPAPAARHARAQCSSFSISSA